MRGKRRWVRCGIAMAMIGALVLLAGCGGSETGPRPSAGNEQSGGGQESGAKKRGGTFRYVDRAPSSPIGVPWEIVSAGVISALPVLEPLLMMDWKGNVSPNLAERWEVDPDQNTVTLYLRRGIKFHDGTEFNAEAVRFNLEKQKEVGRLPTVESIEVVDPYTVRLNLIYYSIDILSTLASTTALQASPTAIEQNGLEWARYHPVGTGPFKFVEYVRDSHAKFERFDEYWNRGDEGKPYVDEIELRFIRDAQTVRAAFLNGDIDAFAASDPAVASELLGMGYPAIDGGSGTSVTVLEPSSANSDSPFADRRVREAVYLAIDREAIAKALGYGLSEPAYQIAHPDWIFYLQDFQGGRYDPDRARQLLAEAGYPNGFSTRLITTNTANREYSTALQEQLAKVGIQVEIQAVENTRYQEYRQGGWEGLLLDVYSFLTGKRVINFFLDEDAPSVYKSLRRPDSLVQLFKQEEEQPPLSQDDERRIGLEMAKAVMEDFTVIPVTTSSIRYIHHPYVKDFTILRWQSYPFWTPADLWLDK